MGFFVDFSLYGAQADQADQAVTNLLGEVQKLEAKRSSVRNVMAQMNKDLGHVKRASLTTSKQLQEKQELMEQVRVWCWWERGVVVVGERLAAAYGHGLFSAAAAAGLRHI